MIDDGQLNVESKIFDNVTPLWFPQAISIMIECLHQPLGVHKLLNNIWTLNKLADVTMQICRCAC